MDSLDQKDRDVLKKASRKLSTHVGMASLVGVSLGLYGAYRLRRMRLAYFQAFKAMEKPTEIRFADGRTGTSRSCHVCTCVETQRSDMWDYREDPGSHG